MSKRKDTRVSMSTAESLAVTYAAYCRAQWGSLEAAVWGERLEKLQRATGIELASSHALRAVIESYKA